MIYSEYKLKSNFLNFGQFCEEAIIKVRTLQETAAAAGVVTVVGGNDISFDQAVEEEEKKIKKAIKFDFYQFPSNQNFLAFHQYIEC